MRTKQRLTENDVRQIRAMYSAGVSVPILSQMFDRHFTGIYKIVQNEVYTNSHYTPNPRKRFPLKLAVELWTSGKYTYREIGKLCANKIGRPTPFCKSLVYSYIRKWRLTNGR